MKRWRKVIALFLLAVLVTVGCGSGKEKMETEVQSENEALNQEGRTQPEELNEPEDVPVEGTEVDKSVYMDASQDVETRIEALLAQMTLEEKVAQMVQPEQAGITPSDVEQYGFGSVLSGGGSSPSSGNRPENWQERVNELKEAALNTRLGIPLLYGIDAVHGNNNVYGAVIYPHNIGLGATGDLELVERIGESAAEEVRAVGIQWTFAPTLGNPQNECWGRTYECFSEDLEEVSKYGRAYIRGFQGEAGTEKYLDEYHVLACAKHFVGEGYTDEGVNQGNISMTQEEFDLLLESGVIDPYTAALDEGVRTVMVSFHSIDGVKCHENKHLITDILKGELGFTGLVVSDYNGIQQLSGVTYKEQVRQGIDAGIDLFMEVYVWEDFIKYAKELVEEGSISKEQIDDAVRRILRVKFEAGLFEEEIGGNTEQEMLNQVGNIEHREIAREAVRKSLVLLKNDKIGEITALQALQNVQNIRVCGQKAYDLGSQCGGWTISWEGSAGNITKGTTIIEGIASQIMPEKTISHDLKGEVLEENDGVIVVFGEGPYVESGGDRTAADLKISAADEEMLENLRASLAQKNRQDIPVIGIIIAGRPVNITEYMDIFDAVIMAWLPGTEGEGVADVLFGDFDFTGKLNFTWMKSPEYMDEKFKEGNEDKILFARGFGLDKNGDILK